MAPRRSIWNGTLGNQRQSVVISGHQWSSPGAARWALSGHQWSSVVISGHHLERHVGHGLPHGGKAFPRALAQEPKGNIEGGTCGGSETEREKRGAVVSTCILGGSGFHISERVAIRGHPRPSEAVRGHHLPHFRASNNQRSSEVISGYQRPSPPQFSSE